VDVETVSLCPLSPYDTNHTMYSDSRLRSSVYLCPGNDLIVDLKQKMAATGKKSRESANFAVGSIRRLYLENFVYVFFLCFIAGI